VKKGMNSSIQRDELDTEEDLERYKGKKVLEVKKAMEVIKEEKKEAPKV
jgi:hypothetical protein